MPRSHTAFALFFVVGCSPNGVILSGTVSDVLTGDSVDAEVCVEDNCTTADTEGVYQLKGVPETTQVLVQITSSNYSPAAVPIGTRQDNIEVATIELIGSLAAGLQYTLLGIDNVPGTGGMAFVVSNGVEGDNLDVFGVTADIDPVVGDGPFYTTDLGLPSTDLDETSEDGGGIWSNLPPGDYTLDFDSLPDGCTTQMGWGIPQRLEFRVLASFTTYIAVECLE